jgi:DNA-binding GntR family transcriptional regulator
LKAARRQWRRKGSFMDDRVSPVDVSTLQKRVYQSLRLSLLRGRFLPGEAVSIRGLATALGTSPMPVREALKRLVAEKVLVQASDRTIRVAPFTPQTQEEVTRIRIHVEGFAAQRAAFSRDPGLIDRLEAINRSMLDAARAHDVEAALVANQAFHFEIYEAAKHPQLLEIISNLWLRAGPFVATAQRRPADALRLFETAFKSHGRIVKGIARRDAKTVRVALAADIRFATIWLRKNYDFEEAAARLESRKPELKS